MHGWMRQLGSSRIGTRFSSLSTNADLIYPPSNFSRVLGFDSLSFRFALQAKIHDFRRDGNSARSEDCMLSDGRVVRGRGPLDSDIHFDSSPPRYPRDPRPSSGTENIHATHITQIGGKAKQVDQQYTHSYGFLAPGLNWDAMYAVGCQKNHHFRMKFESIRSNGMNLRAHGRPLGSLMDARDRIRGYQNVHPSDDHDCGLAL
jgi:hypothetical protein